MKKIIKNVAASAMVGALMLSMTACGSRETEKHSTAGLAETVETKTVTGQELDNEFVKGVTNFSIELFKSSTIDDLNDNQNVLISAESVITALSMAANGAGGDTLDEMMQVMNGGMTQNEFNEKMYTYNESLKSTENVEFNIANSIWVRDAADRISLKEDFLSTNKSYYHSDAFIEPFDDTTVDKMNSWVSENTNEMIPGIIDSVDEGVVMYIVNAIAFDGEWENVYNDNMVNEDGTFTNADGVEQKAAMLNSEENIYISDSRATGFIKNYKGGEFAFMALLPNEGVSIEEYAASMNGETFLDMYNNRSYEEVITQTPEFECDYDTELSDSLRSMGMSDAFDSSADFTNMADTGSGALYISRVLHKTHIELDRNGTRAAAVTSIAMTDGMCIAEEPPKTVILDRPFIYAIINTETGMPIFMGALNSIE